MNQQIKTILPLAAFAAVAMTGATQAAVITPSIDVPLTTVTTAASGFGIGQTVNSSGLTDPNATPGYVLDDVNDNGATQWLSGNSLSGVVTFDLGGTYDVDSVHLWNWVYTNTTSTKWGVATVDFSFSTNGTNFLNTEALSFVADPTPGALGPSVAQTKTFTTQTGVTHIQLGNFTNLEGTTYVGFGEIRFSEAVPEPSTTALLGLGGLALILRRRK